MIERIRKYLAARAERERVSMIVYHGQRDARINNRRAWYEYYRVRG